VRAAGGSGPVRFAPAVRVALPGDAAEALLRDRVLASLLTRVGSGAVALVAPSDLTAVRARLEALGFAVSEADGGPGRATMRAPEAP
jgi:hypothetical protein